MSLSFFIDAKEIASAFKEVADQLEKDLINAVGDLAAATEAKALDLASDSKDGLHSSLKLYKENLKLSKLSEGVWAITLNDPAYWIEEGLKPGTDMKDMLLKNGKTSAAGVKYKVVPFDHKKPPTEMSNFAQKVSLDIKKSLKEDKISWKKIETVNGSPRRGLIHSKNYGGMPPGKGNTPVRDGVSVYQTTTKTGNVRKDVLTFRTVTADQEDKWIHPGTTAKKFMDAAYEWAMKEWDDKILPQRLAKYSDNKG